MTPETAGSENVDVFVQSVREIVTISVGIFVSQVHENIDIKFLPWARVAVKKYWPEVCHTAEQSWRNSGALRSENTVNKEEGRMHESTDDGSTTFGMTPSIIFSILASLPDSTFHTSILPSTPDVVLIMSQYV